MNETFKNGGKKNQNSRLDKPKYRLNYVVEVYTHEVAPLDR